MLVEIDNEIALEMLMNRLEEIWHVERGTDEYALYEEMYESYIDGGVFDGRPFDIMNIVDNDYVNWCRVLEEGEDEYDEVKAAYDNGDRETGHYYIEAERNGLFLVRSC